MAVRDEQNHNNTQVIGGELMGVSEKADRTSTETTTAVVGRHDSNCSTYPSELSDSSVDGAHGRIRAAESPETCHVGPGTARLDRGERRRVAQLQEQSSISAACARIEQLEVDVSRMQKSINGSMEDATRPDDPLSKFEKTIVGALQNVTATGDHAVHAPCIPGSLLSVISEVTEELQDFTYKLAQNQIDLMSEMVCATALNMNNGPFSQLRQTLAQAVAIVSSNAQQQLVNGGGLAVHK
ncbi:hypothetical protein Pmar_PMAR017266 [Perkinsus marinus ATCC 50983]|uniref:Uncharacterized protein n=1 Tax=Perkinsus marinus (strain ATCC 50983 / TXsc) TaxID=423536 RepID=C5LH44_PERM5|nr:hypothetical protein Pmar_PMAR017266 [Perkinsus marinus ATCC 50983]EER03853.1 hypothetical protein Pmar_PMAR017266 [Perkinsus marinus ATCC 50983]|eukprot:XP_002772037.1 hypothetical protein Pmar_PMAR017266 [Perkinsus marinus ATCC 50983]